MELSYAVMPSSLQYQCRPQGAADQTHAVPPLYQCSAIPLDCSNIKANILSRCDPNCVSSVPFVVVFPIPVLFLMSLSARAHQRLCSDLRLVFWVNSLEYSFSTGPQFDLIKLNSFTLYFASGPLPLCLNNNGSAVEGFPLRNAVLQRHGKKRLLDETGKGKLRSGGFSSALSVLVHFSQSPETHQKTGQNVPDGSKAFLHPLCSC